jgi:cell wall-associated NlpC family hydrolase
MTMIRQALVAVVIASCAGVGCATGGAAGGKVARVPRPFPGAPTPGGATEPAGPGPPAVASPGALPLSPGIVATALTLRGTPYRNGGSQPSEGFDCSGFVQWVFAQHGTVLARDVKHQFDSGEKIDARELKPGDLVFFETVSRGPSHVGIAISGDEFVHAPSSKGVVRIERISAEYWSKRWIGAKRVVSATATTDRLAD